MYTKVAAILFLISLLLFSLTVSSSSRVETDDGILNNDWPALDHSSLSYVPDRVLVKLRSEACSNFQAGHGLTTGQTSFDHVLAEAGVVDARPLFAGAQPESRSGCFSSQDSFDLLQIYKMRLESGSDVMTTVERLAADPNVEWAEPDYVAYALDTIPDDPLFSSQWGLTKIQASAAWDVVTGTEAVIIAVLDSGLDETHPDLAGKIWINPADNTVNGIDEDGNGKVDDVHGWNFLNDDNDITDNNGHGTQVVGVAGAAADNGVGVTGVCWNCRVMPVKVMQASGVANYSDIAEGVHYAAEKGADVINLSLGGYADAHTLRAAIEHAVRDEGSVIVAGAGNDDKNTPFYPAAYADVLAVASTAADDTKAAFSDYGPWVDLTAPGVAITTTFSGGGYGAVDGTSMSASFVAGLAGLLRSQHSIWSEALVRAQILHTADFIDTQNPGYTGMLGSGRINADAAVRTTPVPLLSVQAFTVDGANDNPGPGSTFALAVTLYNDWGPVSGLTGALSAVDSYATVDDGAGTFGDVVSGASGDNSGDPFQVTLHSNTPYAHPIPFTLDLSGDGGFNASLPLTVSVRSGFEHLPGGSIIGTDTTWTADKTYVLDGNVVVDENVTLTVEPGTTVMVEVDSWLRIDGALVASGTVHSPISFVRAAETVTTPWQWAGLRFSDKSKATVLDGDGGYVSGSIVRHVHFEHAATAVGINGVGLYIAESAFESNDIGVSVSDDGRATIANCQFTNNDTGVSASGSKLSVTDSSLTHNSTAILAYSTGLTLVGNTIAGNESSIFSSPGWGDRIEARENAIMDNSGSGASLDGEVVFEHNLVVDNGGEGLNVGINSIGSGQHLPIIAYNSQRGEYLVVWQEYRWPPPNDILAQRVSSDGTVIGGEIGVATTISSEHSVQLAYNPTLDQYLAVYAGPDIHGRLLSGDGTPIGQPIPVCTADERQDSPYVVYVPSNDSYLVAWRDFRNDSFLQLYGRLVNSDGTLLSDEIPLMTQASHSMRSGPALAYSPDNGKALAVWYSRQGGARSQWLTINGSQVLTDTPIYVGDSLPEWWEIPTIAYGAAHQQFLVAWRHSNGIYAAVIPTQTITGTGVSTPISIPVVTSTYQPQYPHLSYNPTSDEFLLTWQQDQADVYARYLQYDGHPSEASFAVSTEASPQTYPSAATNTTKGESLVVWQDNRTGTLFIYGQRLDSDGALLDNPNTLQEETDPTVNFRITQARGGIRYNTIINNGGYGLRVRGSYADHVSFSSNNLFGNGTYDLYLETSKDIDASESYWGEIPQYQIPARIYDCLDKEFGCPDPEVGQVTYQPVVTGPITEAPGFVRSIAVTPPLVGIEQAIFDIEFSRSADQGVAPEVSFHLAKRGTSTIYTEADGLADNRVYVVAVGRIEDLWFGSEKWDSKGISRYDGQVWTSYTTHNSGLARNDVRIIYADRDNRVWFGHQNFISRLDSSAWVTFTPESTGWVWDGSQIRDVAQTSDGVMWFGAEGSGVLRYDGTNWSRYTVNDGLPSERVEHLAVDQQNRLWVGTQSHGVAVYNGVSWTVYDMTNGLPGNSVRALSTDSAGRVWVGTDLELSLHVVSKFENGSWTGYGWDNTNGALTCNMSDYPNAIAEDQAGVIWFTTSCGYWAKYDDGQWSRQDGGDHRTRTTAFDAQGDLWTNSGRDGGARILWRGDDYPVTDNARWLDSTHYQATYDINTLVPRGDYNVVVSGTRSASTMLSGTMSIPLPAGDMLIPPETRQSFSVDYAGAVADVTPPSIPLVAADLCRNSTTEASASWTAKDQDSSITLYRYALGTSNDGTDVINWIDTVATFIVRTSLNLVRGQHYVFSVKARNEGGLWSESGYGRFVAGVPCRQVFLPMVLKNR